MKNIVITGCSSGIGLETALFLREKGIKVYPSARKENDVKKLKEMGFEAFRLDLRDYESIKNTIKEVVKRDGKIDIWFNNAGYGQPGALEDIETKVLKEQFETNVFGLHEATREVLKVMLKQGYGKIIQHSSVLGLVAMPFRGAYNASKYAVEGLSDTLRLELKETNVHVISLNTGPIESKFRENAKKNLKRNVDIENSRFKKIYEKTLKSEKSSVPFILPASAVAETVYKIILAKNPKPRYYITKATYLLGFAKRVLPTSLLDRILINF